MTRLWPRHVSHQLARYCDGRMTRQDAAAVDAHLADCPRCRADRDAIVFAAGLVRELAAVTAPADLWPALDARLRAATPQPPQRGWTRQPRPVLAWALGLLLATTAALWLAGGSPSGAWTVTRSDGAAAQLAPGTWVETGRAGGARIVVGDIGTVNVEPGSRVQLGVSGPGEHRLALARGTVSVEITAPPRVFVLETPVSTVVDLGCAYTVTVDGAGGRLRMTEGWAALEWNGRESLVPAGAVCRMRQDAGPGLPYFEDAPAALQRAVEAFESGSAGTDAVEAMLEAARPRDTLTLWHLFARLPQEHRGRVYDRMAMLAEPPTTMSRELAIALDADTLRAWREELAWNW
jgi:anti-sigma factor RsiW